MEPHIIEEIIYASIKTKAEIVTKDEKENGIRAILNFGHKTLLGRGAPKNIALGFVLALK